MLITCELQIYYAISNHFNSFKKSQYLNLFLLCYIVIPLCHLHTIPRNESAHDLTASLCVLKQPPAAMCSSADVKKVEQSSPSRQHGTPYSKAHYSPFRPDYWVGYRFSLPLFYF